jgi:hypothetical protein
MYVVLDAYKKRDREAMAMMIHMQLFTLMILNSDWREMKATHRMNKQSVLRLHYPLLLHSLKGSLAMYKASIGHYIFTLKMTTAKSAETLDTFQRSTRFIPKRGSCTLSYSHENLKTRVRLCYKFCHFTGIK